MPCIKGLTSETCPDAIRNKFNVILVSKGKEYCKEYCSNYIPNQEIKNKHEQHIHK